MFRKTLHKIISIFAVVTVLLPMSLQLVHSLEAHNHEVCKEKTNQHVHSNETDCEFDHYLFKTNGDLVIQWKQPTDIHTNTNSRTHPANIPHLNSLFPTLSRGSPQVII